MVMNGLRTRTAGRERVRWVRDGMKDGHGTWTRGERRHRAIAPTQNWPPSHGSLNGAVNTVTCRAFDSFALTLGRDARARCSRWAVSVPPYPSYAVVLRGQRRWFIGWNFDALPVNALMGWSDSRAGRELDNERYSEKTTLP